MRNLVPKGMPDSFLQLGLVLRLLHERVLKQRYTVGHQAFPALALTKRHTLVQPQQSLVVTKLQLVALLGGGDISKKQRYVLHLVSVYLRQAIEGYIYQFLKVFIRNIKHYFFESTEQKEWPCLFVLRVLICILFQ